MLSITDETLLTVPKCLLALKIPQMNPVITRLIRIHSSPNEIFSGEEEANDNNLIY